MTGSDAQKNLFGEQQRIPLQRRRRARPAKYQGPLFPLANGKPAKLEKAFWKFHEANPTVYRLMVRFARQWRERRGPQAVMGVKQLFERVRWELALTTVDLTTVEDFHLKLNNNHHAFYARLIMDRNPDLQDVFRLRKQRVASTIGSQLHKQDRQIEVDPQNGSSAGSSCLSAPSRTAAV